MSNKKTLKAVKKKPAPPVVSGDFDSLVSSIVHIHQQTQAFATKAVNVSLTLRNWLIGHRIEVYERQGADRATYGDKLMDTLAKRLVKQGWARCERRELYRFRQFYLAYPKIVESLTPQSLLLPELSPLLAFVPSAAIARVAERVRQGGHDIPEAVIRRRFTAGLRNLEKVYKSAVDTWANYDNVGERPILLEWGENE